MSITLLLFHFMTSTALCSKLCLQNYLCRFETAMRTQAGPEWEELDGSSSARDDLHRCMAQGQSSYYSMPRIDGPGANGKQVRIPIPSGRCWLCPPSTQFFRIILLGELHVRRARLMVARKKHRYRPRLSGRFVLQRGGETALYHHCLLVGN